MDLNNLTLAILSVSTIVFVLDASGFLPPWIAKWIARNRLENILVALRKLDVRVTWDEGKRSITFKDRILDSTCIKEFAYKSELRAMLDRDTFKGDVQIGGTTLFNSEKFIDVMGATCHVATAVHYAKLLQTHYKIENIPSFDIIATPRTGSPLLGYEFSRLSQKPFVMGVSEKVKDNGQTMGHHSKLDYPKDFDLKGKIVMLVDDSTTGGRKQIELVESLRKAGAIVNISLVLFEPQGKGARKSLANIEVVLHSTLEGPDGKY